MSAKTDVIDDLVCNQKLTYEWQSIMDMVSDGGGWKVGTLRNSLYRLRELGLVERKWEGNQRFGRYLYRLAEAIPVQKSATQTQQA